MTFTPEQQQQIAEFLETGYHDPLPYGWTGDWVTALNRADEAMRDALIAELRRRSEGLAQPTGPVMDYKEFTRRKVVPMVNGLFPASERGNVLSMFDKSVVFLTAENIEDVLRGTKPLSSAWKLANLYLSSIDGRPLSDTAPLIVGLSERTTCYVSYEYFTQTNRFADFVVHEAAHVFHNCKRYTVGLPETRTKDFLLNIDIHQRETFAYACEVYSRMLELTNSRKERLALLQEIEDDFTPPDDKVNLDNFRSALAAAATATNGWKKILQACAPEKRPKQKCAIFPDKEVK